MLHLSGVHAGNPGSAHEHARSVRRSQGDCGIEEVRVASPCQVAEEIWVVGDNTVSKWPGSIEEYKEHLRATHVALTETSKKAEMTER